MKNFFGLIFFIILFPSLACGVETIGSNYGSENLIEPSKQRPVQITAEYDAIFPSNFSDSEFKRDKIRFSEANGELRFVCCYEKCCNEGIYISAGYTNTYLGWSENPYFSQEYFNSLTTTIAGWTERVNNWLWQAQVAMNFDLDHYDFDYYSTWDLLLWGRYSYNSRIGIHAGFLAQTGMMIDRYYPIFGFDWQINQKWKLNAVFPVNFSIVYQPNCRWSFALASRFFDSRHRTGENEPVPMATFEYRTAGAELAVNYDYKDIIVLNVHAGSTVGGQLKIANKHHKHGKHLNFDAAPYVGGKAVVKF